MPRYTPDEHHLAFADTDVPLLMLQGTWDPATRPGPAAALKEAYKGAHQRWVEIPRGAHGALQSVPTKDGASCGTAIVMSFLHDPEAPPDTSCLSDLAPLSFDGFSRAEPAAVRRGGRLGRALILPGDLAPRLH